MDTYVKKNPAKIAIDALDPTDYAYAMLVCESSKAVWEEDRKVKLMTSEEREVYEKVAVPKYHVKKGTKLPVYQDGCLDEGKKRYQDLVEIFKRWVKDELFWNKIREHWTHYAKTNNRYHRDVRRMNHNLDKEEDDEVEVPLFDFSDDEEEDMDNGDDVHEEGGNICMEGV